MRLKELRLSKGWSLDELSKMIGVSDQTISNWERGKNQPGIKNLIKLADIFDISIDYLVGRDVDELLLSLLMHSNLADVDDLRAIVNEYIKSIKQK